MPAPRPAPPPRPLAVQTLDAVPKMSLDLEDCLCRAVQDKLRLQTVPARDSASLLPSMRLLLKRREVVEVERALQAQREEFGQRMALLAQRRQRLGQREAQLREDTLKFNTFLKAMSARRVRVLRRAGEERAQAARQEAQAMELQRELGGLQQRRERLGRRLRSLRVFGDFLQAVQAAMGQDVPSVLAHFGVLAGVRAVLLQQGGAGREALAQGRAQLQQYQEEADTELEQEQEEMQQLRARLEAARHDVLQGETRWAQLRSAAAQRTLQLGQIRMAVLGLFQLATTWLNVSTAVGLQDTEAQLDVVLLCMQDLAAICAELCPMGPELSPHPPPATTTTHPQRHRAVTVPPSQEEMDPGDNGTRNLLPNKSRTRTAAGQGHGEHPRGQNPAPPCLPARGMQAAGPSC